MYKCSRIHWTSALQKYITIVCLLFNSITGTGLFPVDLSMIDYDFNILNTCNDNKYGYTNTIAHYWDFQQAGQYYSYGLSQMICPRITCLKSDKVRTKSCQEISDFGFLKFYFFRRDFAQRHFVPKRTVTAN